MKRRIGFLLPLFLFFVGCAAVSETVAEDRPPSGTPGPAPTGELRLLFDAEPDTLDYLVTDDEGALLLAANITDTLLEFDASGRLCPGLAESWAYDAGTRIWTLTLREDTVWVDADGRETAPLTAQDFAAAARHILTPANDSPAADELIALIANAEEYYNGLDPENEAEPIDFAEVGVRAADERTLCYSLKKDAPDFLSRLTGRAFLPVCASQLEKGGFGETDELPWSCGAYRLAARDPQAETLLRKNSRYRDRDSVFIETVRFVFDPDAAVNGPLLAADGAVGYAPLDDETAADWLADPARVGLVSMERPNPERSYFLCFNFNVRALNTDYTREGMTGWSLPEQYEPENWERAVNCEAFRQSVRHALDSAALYGGAPVGNTITPARFSADPATGADYTVLRPFSDLGDPHDTALALEYRDAAAAALAEQGGTFPVKVLLRCPADDENAHRRCEQIARQLEETLGADYIDVIVEAVSAENYWTLVRRGSGYMLLECFWDADSPDVDTWTRPFYQPLEPDGSYGRGYRYAYMACAVTDGLGGADAVRAYFGLVEKARDVTEPSARLAAFAKAEAQLLEHALALPLGAGESRFAVSRLDRSGCPNMGLARLSFKGARLTARPVSMAESLAAAALPEPTPVPETEPTEKAYSVSSNQSKK